MDMKTEKIMIVEDEAIVAMSIKNLLKKMKYPVVGIFPSGEEAVEQVEQHNPDIILMDINLAGEMNGIETAREINKKTYVPIIYMTAYADEATLEEAKITEPFGYIIKPFIEKDIRGTLEMALYKQKIEKKLRVNEEKYRLIVDNLTDLIIKLDTDGNFIFASPSFTSTFGREEEKLIGKSFLQLVHTDHRDSTEKALEPLLNEPYIKYIEHKALTREGWRWFGWSIRSVINNLGEPVELVCTGRDITDKINFEDKLRSYQHILEDRNEELIETQQKLFLSRDKYFNLFDFAPIGYMTIDEHGLIKDSNIRIAEMLIISRIDIIDKNLTDFISEESLEEYTSFGQKLMNTTTKQSCELIMLRTNGEKFNALLDGISEFEGQNVKFLIAFVDITDRVKAQSALKESEAKHRLVSGMVSDFVYSGTINQKGEITYKWLSGAYRKILGYSFEEIIKNSNLIQSIIHPDDINKVKQNLKNLFQNKPAVNEYRIITKENDICWLRDYVKPEYDEKKSTVLGIIGGVQDITENKKYINELNESHQRLRNLTTKLELSLEEERKKIAIEIHDNIGQLLTALTLDLSWLMKKVPDDREDLNIKLDEMYELINKTSDMVSMVTSQLRPTILDHFGLIPALQWQAEEFKKRSNIDFDFNYPEEHPEFDEITSIVVFRTFQEALTNIIRHSKADFVEIDLSIKENFLKLQVTDNGIGINQDQINNPNSFGLMGIKERANSIGGSFNVFGNNDSGTTLEVLVPLKNQLDA